MSERKNTNNFAQPELPYTLTTGVTATRAGLEFNPDKCVAYRLWDDFCEPWIVSPGETLRYEWPDAAERLRYREGEPWCGIPYPGRDVSILVCYQPQTPRHIDALHRLAAIFCDDAEAFRVLHWCIEEFGNG